MANCKRIEPEQPEFELTLSAKEAGTLLDIFGHVGGHPEGTNRKYISAIMRALYDCGVSACCAELSGSVMFEK